MNTGDKVRHKNFGFGTVEFDKGATTIVRFVHGLEECEKASLETISGPLEAVESGEWHAPLRVVARTQAAAIESINDAWGIFSPSRIALLPHQLWVCRRVVEKWPARWLVADDVGLGKTIEAGLILWPLLAKGTVKRLLILCSAALVEQWQERLRTMFDIRLSQYVTEADTAKTDFWGTHNQVVASLETLRLAKENRQKERQDRLIQTAPWDLLIVDEAHHLNADEQSGPTLGYRLAKTLVEGNKVSSMVFFTGTPHRGKNYAFLSLLALLRPDLFDSDVPMEQQLTGLREVMIRNPKNSVTDLRGNRLFKPSIVRSETFTYSKEEDEFYKTLTEFILTGKAYASALNATEGKAVMLVLIALQKLASSSVAAIRRSLKGRLTRIVDNKGKLIKSQNLYNQLSQRCLSNYEEMERLSDADEISELEQNIAKLTAELRLMENEEQRLRELIAVADQVTEETKINKIMSILDNTFSERSVLFFTEYKATQSLLLSALMKKFGEDSIAFINGDGKAEEVLSSTGTVRTLYGDRNTAAQRFNGGQARFLVTTEAAGEGIDLQENCHTLIHVDLPWNPMRLHQRVGRLNRYGQSQQVEVMTLRNPDTVESLIWDKLNEKIDRIMMALGTAMDEPEDLLQMVLGMTSPSLFREIFAEGEALPKDSLSSWFNQKTASFGGNDVVETVKELVGNCARFDFQQVSSQIPKLDLPALRPFLISMLYLNNRKIREDLEGVSFKTPEAWLSEPGIRTSYENMIFERQNKSRNAMHRILGVGHKLVNEAIKQAKNLTESACVLPSALLHDPIFVFQLYDRVTGSAGPVKVAVAGVKSDMNGCAEDVILKDWELLEVLNDISRKPTLRKQTEELSRASFQTIHSRVAQAADLIANNIATLDLPFTFPAQELIAILWPSSTETQASEEKEEEN